MHLQPHHSHWYLLVAEAGRHHLVTCLLLPGCSAMLCPATSARCHVSARSRLLDFTNKSTTDYLFTVKYQRKPSYQSYNWSTDMEGSDCFGAVPVTTGRASGLETT